MSEYIEPGDIERILDETVRERRVPYPHVTVANNLLEILGNRKEYLIWRFSLVCQAARANRIYYINK